MPRPEDFRSRLRGPEIAARVGVWLGICFALAFVTGLISHLAQNTPGWLTFPTRPVSLYRITQGVHVISGTAAIPLLLVKLWSVFPRLFNRLDLLDARRLTVQVLERGSVAVLVAGAVFELATGVANTAQWYPWSFHFRSTHFAVGWLVTGALIVHIGVKLPVIGRALSSPLDENPALTAQKGTLTRRGFLRTAWLAAGVAAVATAGATVPALRRISVLEVRSGSGPGGIPINKSAVAAGVTATATDPAYRLTIVNGPRSVSYRRADLEAMPQTRATLPIACVEGWSASGEWIGVRLSHLLAGVGADPHSDVKVESLQQHGNNGESLLQAQFAADDLTLVALGLDGETLSIDHGYPCRLIAPDRPGVLQTKWLSRIVVET